MTTNNTCKPILVYLSAYESVCIEFVAFYIVFS